MTELHLALSMNVRVIVMRKPVFGVVLSISVLMSGLMSSTSSLIVVGAFTNMRFTEDHAYGYEAQIWQEGNNIFGLFLAACGQVGDTPTGILEDVKFDPKTGRFAFRARLTLGIVYNQKHDGTPSRDVFHFNGVMQRSKIEGTLEISNALLASQSPQREKITLNRSEEQTSSMEVFTNYAEWKKSADEILKLRGPKW
jgi:hypothetical protein